MKGNTNSQIISSAQVNKLDNLEELTVSEVHDAVYDILYPALPAPTNVTASGTTLSFDSVEGAESYVVYADGNEIGEYIPGGNN